MHCHSTLASSQVYVLPIGCMKEILGGLMYFEFCKYASLSLSLPLSLCVCVCVQKHIYIILNSLMVQSC